MFRTRYQPKHREGTLAKSNSHLFRLREEGDKLQQLRRRRCRLIRRDLPKTPKSVQNQGKNSPHRRKNSTASSFGADLSFVSTFFKYCWVSGNNGTSSFRAERSADSAARSALTVAVAARPGASAAAGGGGGGAPPAARGGPEVSSSILSTAFCSAPFFRPLSSAPRVFFRDAAVFVVAAAAGAGAGGAAVARSIGGRGAAAGSGSGAASFSPSSCNHKLSVKIGP